MDGDDVVIGKYHVINSKGLGEQRRILVNLPDGYESTKLKYPVVYHLYGDFVMQYFADAASAIDRLSGAGKIPQVILIGVDNTDRYRDLRPLLPNGAPGGIEKFIQYIKEELMPFVKDKYRTTDYNILVGPQAGACFGIYTLMEHRDLFNAYILDNSFDNPQIVDDYLLSKATNFFKPNKSLSTFLFMKVDKDSPNLQVAMEEKKVIESNLPKGFRFEFKLNETENNFMIQPDFTYGLIKLFAGYELPIGKDITGLDDIKNYYHSYFEKIGYSVSIPERTLTLFGDRFSQSGNTNEAKRIWNYLLEINPKSLNGLFRTAQMNSSDGKFEEARKYFTEFLKIRPQEAMVQNQLKRIDKMIKESATYEIEQVILSAGMKQGQETYARLKNSNQQSKYFDENEFVNTGYRFLSTGKLTQAIEIFKMAVEQFPQSFNTWDCLGEAYLKSGNKELAIKNYKKSLELNPKNDNAKNMLEQLHK